MPSTSHEIESRGATVDAAVEAGLRRLGLDRGQVTITVIDEGSRGLLGIGSREAVVRLAPLAITPPPSPAPPPPSAPRQPETPPARIEKPPVARQQPPPMTAPAKPPAPPVVKKPAPVEKSIGEDDHDAAPATADELEAERETAISIISELLDKMRVPAGVTGYLSEPDDLTGQQVNVIDVNGEDLAMLIGPRGETLDALQFLGRLMVAHKLHRRSNFVVDVEGYRQRRVQALTRLAERMADKVRQRGEPISLEPMSAYERRIIHMTLRDAGDVYTESAGEGKQRRVRIFPKQ